LIAFLPTSALITDKNGPVPQQQDQRRSIDQSEQYKEKIEQNLEQPFFLPHC
jgi:hypothetical protein